MIKNGTIIPPKPKDGPSLMKLALAQGKNIQSHFQIAELNEKIILLENKIWFWRTLALMLTGWTLVESFFK